MNNPRTYSLPDVFNNTLMGFTFEFYSSKDTNFIVDELRNVRGVDKTQTMMVLNEY